MKPDQHMKTILAVHVPGFTVDPFIVFSTYSLQIIMSDL